MIDLNQLIVEYFASSAAIVISSPPFRCMTSPLFSMAIIVSVIDILPLSIDIVLYLMIRFMSSSMTKTNCSLYIHWRIARSLCAWADKRAGPILTLLAGSVPTFERPNSSMQHWLLDSFDQRIQLTAKERR
jgi:hypothetical protein